MAIQPSIILSSSCCTPSPETSRVMDRFMPSLRAILSNSSMYTMPCSARLMSQSAAWISLRRIFSTSSPTYPDSVRDVASHTAKGTFKVRAKVSAKRVFPHPVGPTSKMLVFWSSMSDSDLWLLFQMRLKWL